LKKIVPAPGRQEPFSKPFPKLKFSGVALSSSPVLPTLNLTDVLHGFHIVIDILVCPISLTPILKSILVLQQTPAPAALRRPKA